MATTQHEHRFYRHSLQVAGLVDFQVVVKETDLHIHALRDLAGIARETVIEIRGYLESYISQHPQFAETVIPWHLSGPAPSIIRDMARAGAFAGVGPMAAVAGAIAAHVGKDLLVHSTEVIVENGGDVFMATARPITMGIYAGRSPLSLRLGLKIGGQNEPVSVCTSSGTVGHSLSTGRADAVCIVSKDCALADAAATATGNRVRDATDIQKAIEYSQTVSGVEGLVVIIGDQMGVWGDVELVPLERNL